MDNKSWFVALIVTGIFAGILGMLIGQFYVPQQESPNYDFNYGFVDVLREDSEALAANQLTLSIQLARSVYFGVCVVEDGGIREINLNNDTYVKRHIYLLQCPLQEGEQ